MARKQRPPSPVVVLFALFFMGSASAEPLSFDGVVGLGGRFGGSNTSKVLYETALSAATPRVEGARAVFEVAADQDARELALQEGFFDYRESCAPAQFRAGRGRKKIGWEYEHPSAARLGVQRTLPYEFLAERSLVGREYFAGFDWHLTKNERAECARGTDPGEFLDGQWMSPERLIDPNGRIRFGLNATFNESNDYSLLAHGLFTLSPSWRLGAWAQAQRLQTKNVHDPLYVWAGAASALFQGGIHRAELELFLGHDPLASRLEKERPTGKGNTSFAAASLGYGIYPGAWNPYLLGSFLKRDLSLTAHAFTLASGLRFFFRPKLSLAAEFKVEALRSASMGAENYSGLFLGRYYF